MRDSPCKGCEDRQVKCHATCKEYIEWLEETREENERIKKEREKENLANHNYQRAAAIEKRLRDYKRK